MSKKTPIVLADDPSLELDDGTLQEVEVGQVVYRPDGYHWQTADGKQEFGPFASMDEALGNMQRAAEGATEEGETLEEAEDELGISDWVDPDTGELAEGYSTPHLSDE